MAFEGRDYHQAFEETCSNFRRFSRGLEAPEVAIVKITTALNLRRISIIPVGTWAATYVSDVLKRGML